MTDTLVTVNGLPCLQATLRLPRTGVWIADLVVDATAAIEGSVTVSVGQMTLKGRAARTGLARDTAVLRVLAGAGGLSAKVPAKFYRRCPAKAPLQDILAAAGEMLSSTVEAGLLNQQLVAFVLVRQKAADALRALADKLGVTWRVLEDGTVWLGEESWPDANVSLDLIADDPRQGFTEYGSDSPTLLPGTTLDGKRVSQVEHRILPASVRTRVWFETGDGLGDRLTAAIAAIVRHLTAHVDYHALYPAKVVSQNSDGTLELQPDGDVMPGLSKVPIRLGLPGVTVKVKKDARVLVGFESGDSAAPVATLWEVDGLDEITVTAATKATVKAETVNVEASGTANVKGGTVNVDAGSGTTTVKGGTVNVEGTTKINLGGAAATMAVALMGDTAGPYPLVCKGQLIKGKVSP